MAFSAIYKPKRARNRPFFPFSYISGGFKGLFDFYDTLHHHPWTGRSPRQYSAHQAVLEPPMQSLALSKCRSGASDFGRDMTQSLPFSYWSPKKSYMTSSRTATKIYIATWFRVKTCTVGKLTKVCFIKLDWTQLYWGSNYNSVDYVILRSCTMCGNIGDKNLWKQTITKYWGISHFNGSDCQSQHLGLLFLDQTVRFRG
jgi:hypothetical protein